MLRRGMGGEQDLLPIVLTRWQLAVTNGLPTEPRATCWQLETTSQRNGHVMKNATRLEEMNPSELEALIISQARAIDRLQTQLDAKGELVDAIWDGYGY